MKKVVLILVLLAGCDGPEFRRNHSEKEMRAIVREEVRAALLDEPRVVTKEVTEKVHRYEVNLNQLKIPNETGPVTVTGSAFVSSCTEQDLNLVRDWLMANVTHDCPQRVKLEESGTMGLRINAE